MGHKPFRFGLSGVSGSAAALALSAAAIAAPLVTGQSCIDPYNSGHTFYDPNPNGNNYYYARVDTASSCTYPDECTWVYVTQGVKTSLSTEGNPVVPDDYAQHVAQWVTAAENGSDCTTTGQTGSGCWIQTGWQLGYSSSPCTNPIQSSTAIVYVEIYDDSSAPCYLASYGNAPTAASYDTRYYSTLGNGLHRYQVYYQAPGSSIQDLAYGDLKDYSTASGVGGEGAAGADGSTCPTLGQDTINEWNKVGYGTTPSTFAAQVSLYQNGSWYQWTSSVPNVQTAYYPHSGNTLALYQLQPITSFGTNYTQWETGGPNG